MPVETKAQNLVYQTQDDSSRAATVINSAIYSYLPSTVAPASTNFFWIAAASSLLTPSLIGLGAPSTRSLASFSPRLVTSRTALITLILFAPAAVSTTENSVFSSAGAAPAPAPGPPAITTGAAAAAETLKASSIFLTRSAASSSVSPLISSRIPSTLLAIAVLLQDCANLFYWAVPTGSGPEPPAPNLSALTASLSVTTRFRETAASAVAILCAGACSRNIILLINSSLEGKWASCWISSIESTRPWTTPALNRKAGTSLATLVSTLASATGSVAV